ncbi:MAG: hypothetical protein AB6733_04210 [Clostridiaceae bacterium]
MKFLRGVIGFSLAAIIINSLWGVFVTYFGVLGGYISALILTGSMWFLNHYIGIIQNEKESAYIDMGLGIAIALVTRDMINQGAMSVISSMPTFSCVIVGAILGGIAAGLIEKQLGKSKISYKTIDILSTKFIND